MTHIHTCFISYRRGDLLRRAVASYLHVTAAPVSVVVVDNGSDDPATVDTLRALDQQGILVIQLGENRYPGYACNVGWGMAPAHTGVLHRADNDFEFRPGWDIELLRRFNSDPKLGQVGLRTDEEELFAPWNVGGNCAIRRDLWDAGLRWDERPWSELGGTTEDYYLTQAVIAAGWRWGRVEQPCIMPISVESPDDPYYQETWGVRGIHQHLLEGKQA